MFLVSRAICSVSGFARARQYKDDILHRSNPCRFSTGSSFLHDVEVGIDLSVISSGLV